MSSLKASLKASRFKKWTPAEITVSLVSGVFKVQIEGEKEVKWTEPVLIESPALMRSEQLVKREFDWSWNNAFNELYSMNGSRWIH